MKKTTLLLFMTIFMIVITTVMILLAFYVMPANRFNLCFITLLSTLGYLGAFCYYDTYLMQKGGKGL